jgi:hypothetical protein
VSDQQVDEIRKCVDALTAAMNDHPERMPEVRALALDLIHTIDDALAAEPEGADT